MANNKPDSTMMDDPHLPYITVMLQMPKPIVVVMTWDHVEDCYLIGRVLAQAKTAEEACQKAEEYGKKTGLEVR